MHRRSTPVIGLVIGVILMCGGWTIAQEVGEEEGVLTICWQLLRSNGVAFNDIITVQASDVIPGRGLIEIEDFDWIGPDDAGNVVYQVDGSGTAVYNARKDIYTDGPVGLQNPSAFFGDHRLGTFTARRGGGSEIGTVVGVWAAQFFGPPGTTTFVTGGLLRRISCEEAIVAVASPMTNAITANALQASTGQTPNLAGIP